MSTCQQVLTTAATEIQILTLVLDSIAAERLVVTTTRESASNGIRKQRNMVPSLPSGNGAVQPYGEGLVQVRVEGGERSLVSRRQRGEWGGRVAARRSARTANGDDRLGVLVPSVDVGPGVVVLPAALVASVCWPVALWESSDDTGQGNGSDERDDGFMEQHCSECIKGVVVSSVCLVG